MTIPLDSSHSPNLPDESIRWRDLLGPAPRLPNGDIDVQKLENGFVASQLWSDEPDLEVIDAEDRQAMFGIDTTPVEHLPTPEEVFAKADRHSAMDRAEATVNKLRNRLKDLES